MNKYSIEFKDLDDLKNKTHEFELAHKIKANLTRQKLERMGVKFREIQINGGIFLVDMSENKINIQDIFTPETDPISLMIDRLDITRL